MWNHTSQISQITCLWFMPSSLKLFTFLFQCTFLQTQIRFTVHRTGVDTATMRSCSAWSTWRQDELTDITQWFCLLFTLTGSVLRAFFSDTFRRRFPFAPRRHAKSYPRQNRLRQYIPYVRRERKIQQPISRWKGLMIPSGAAHTAAELRTEKRKPDIWHVTHIRQSLRPPGC